MTFDLGVWKSSPGLSITSASFIYSALCGGQRDARVLRAAEAIASFYEELIATWPEIPAASSKLRNRRTEIVDSPWAAPLLRAEDYVLLSCDFRHAEIALAYVTALAGRHGLTVFDPQSEEVYAPESGG